MNPRRFKLIQGGVGGNAGSDKPDESAVVSVPSVPSVSSIPSALTRGAKLAAGKEHTVVQLARKLKQKGYQAEEIATALETLKAKNYLNDERATAAYIDERRRKGFGPRRIAVELQVRGVAGETARRQLRELYPDSVQQDTLASILAKTPARLKATPDKLAANLQRKGFSADLIRAALGNMAMAADAELEENEF